MKTIIINNDDNYKDPLIITPCRTIEQTNGKEVNAVNIELYNRASFVLDRKQAIEFKRYITECF